MTGGALLAIVREGAATHGLENLMSSSTLKTTPLTDLHRALGAKLVAFAGYEMPLHYEAGILAEHKHTRDGASLFDVSHMGQAWLAAPDHARVAKALESLVPGDIAALGQGRMRYSLLLNAKGGILDDLMV